MKEKRRLKILGKFYNDDKKYSKNNVKWHVNPMWYKMEINAPELDKSTQSFGIVYFVSCWWYYFFIYGSNDDLLNVRKCRKGCFCVLENLLKDIFNPAKFFKGKFFHPGKFLQENFLFWNLKKKFLPWIIFKRKFFILENILKEIFNPGKSLRRNFLSWKIL